MAARATGMEAIEACEALLAELLECAAGVLDATSGVGDADEAGVLERCAEFREGVLTVQAELKEIASRARIGVPVDSDVYASRARAQLQARRAELLLARVSEMEGALGSR